MPEPTDTPRTTGPCPKCGQRHLIEVPDGNYTPAEFKAFMGEHPGTGHVQTIRARGQVVVVPTPPPGPEPGAYADAAGSSRAFEAMRREVGSLRDDALVKERKYADLWGAAEPNGWTNHVAAYDEVLAVIDELEELS